MRDHYKLLDNPILDLPPEATTNMFAEMDQIADELRTHGGHVPDDHQIAFRQLQKARLPHLTKEQWLDLFELWRLRYDARQHAKAEEDQLHAIALWKERCKLGALCPLLSPAQCAAVAARLREIALALADITMPQRPESRKVANWA
jgi:hypothetical protein